LAEIAFTATRISRPRGSGLAVSKSISASAVSIGSDFLYPTAFMLVVSIWWRHLTVALARIWQVL
jgi:hypothetical protein